MALPQKPITNIERYLARMAGQDVPLPQKPTTNVEHYLDYIATHSAAVIDVPSCTTALTLAGNTKYYLTDVGELALTYPSDAHWACWIKLTTAASGTVSITFPEGTAYIGAEPSLGNGETWELSIEDGVVVAGRALAAAATRSVSQSYANSIDTLRDTDPDGEQTDGTDGEVI